MTTRLFPIPLRAILLGFAWSAAAIVAIPAAPAAAQAEIQDEQAARDFIQQLSDDAFAALADPALSGPAQRQRFRELLSAGVALDYVGKVVLGRFRRDASPEQLAEYERIFPEYIITIYTDRILQANDEKLEILSVVPQGKADIFVRTQLVSDNGAPPISADWRVRRMKDGVMRIIDMRVEGISLAETKKDEFASLIGSRGFDGFLAQLRRDSGAGKPS